MIVKVFFVKSTSNSANLRVLNGEKAVKKVFQPSFFYELRIGYLVGDRILDLFMARGIFKYLPRMTLRSRTFVQAERVQFFLRCGTFHLESH